MAPKTLLVGFAHPDDELGAAGTIAAHRARGVRVVIVWLTRGEKTEAFGPLRESEVARRRVAQGERAGEILGAETRFLDFPDTGLVASPQAAAEVARVVAQIAPDALLTWGDGWTRGIRHPDHQACGRIFRDALTLARIAKTVAPEPPHRGAAPVFTMRDVHSPLPAVVIDVEPYLDTIRELARFYLREIGFGDEAWLMQRLRKAGAGWGLGYAEEFDAWETEPGRLDDFVTAMPIPGVTPPGRPKPASGS